MSEPDCNEPCNDQPNSASGVDADRDTTTGRFAKGNTAALVHGQASLSFWADVNDVRSSIRRAILTDCGYDEHDAPRVLAMLADKFAQTALVGDSAFERLVREGGALTSNGRVRRVFNVWQSALDRQASLGKLIGVERRTRPVSFQEALARLASERPLDDTASTSRLGQDVDQQQTDTMAPTANDDAPGDAERVDSSTDAATDDSSR